MAVPLSNEGPLTLDERKRVITAVEGHMVRWGLKQTEVARSCKGISAGSLSAILNLKYPAGTLDDHLRDLNDWIEQDADRRERSVGGKRPLVTTAVVEWINTAAAMCRQNATMGVVMGPAGVGKTATAEIVSETIQGAIYISINSDNRTQQTLLGDLCDRLKVGRANRSKGLRGKSRFRRVVEQLSDSHRLLILDDADKLNDTALELLREIHDATRVPILMIGVVDLWERIRRRDDADHGQLKSRIGVRFNLLKVTGSKPLITRKQIREICSLPKVRLVGAADRHLYDLVNNHGEGAIRRCKHVVLVASRLIRNRRNLTPQQTVEISENDLHVAMRSADMSGYEIIERPAAAEKASRIA